ncbi:hypothetical protein K6L05_00120 [Salinicoccus roseus]|uniref:hypothetical protein n=1 Tax=Salinicoccus roseus TaxID=45670 RepID=UPI001CA71BF8|nr:hypothetical protein [Salinicoccus roseus]MBY8908190.1 hypothetical protein [Salinicoccus roseus]
MKYNHHCNGGCGDRIEMQAAMIRNIKLDRRQLFRENHDLKVENKTLSEELKSVKAQLETQRVINEQQRQKVHLMHRSKDYRQPDANWPGRIEVEE